MPTTLQADHHPARRGLRVLRRRLPIILAALVITPAVTVAYSLSQPKQYTACSALLFRNPGFDTAILGAPSFSPSTDPARDAATNLRLVSLSNVAQRTARQVGHGTTSGTVQNEVNISSEGQSDLVAICMTDRSPARAAQLADVFAQQFIVFRREADRAKINQAIVLSQKKLSLMPSGSARGIRGRLLRQRIDQLQTVADLQTGNAELVQPASSPTGLRTSHRARVSSASSSRISLKPTLRSRAAPG